MTENEFNAIGTYMTGLWPKYVATPEQRAAWWDALRIFDLELVRIALQAAYQSDLFNVPKIPDVRKAIQNYQRQSAGDGEKDFSAQYKAQIVREEAEEAALIADWTDQEREAGRLEIIQHEPGMRMLLPPGRPRGPMLTHFLVERYVHNRITLFRGRLRTRQPKGERLQIFEPQPYFEQRDTLWGAFQGK